MADEKKAPKFASISALTDLMGSEPETPAPVDPAPEPAGAPASPDAQASAPKPQATVDAPRPRRGTSAALSRRIWSEIKKRDAFADESGLVRLTVKLPAAMHADLRILSIIENTSIQAYGEQAFAWVLEQARKRNPDYDG